ncbi:MAG TPA: hypothetical protein VNX70_02360 [Bryobacteraceae bacterium]|jgi:hypothetical protein|nr:hypothetical protein [Bryobacteraceae bacterium]
MRLKGKLFWRLACAATIAAMTATPQQTPTIIPLTSAGNIGAAPNGISSTSGELLFTQPYCHGFQSRGTYKVNLPGGGSTLVETIPEVGQCSENYLVMSQGLGGFTAGDRYATGASITNPSNEAVYKNGSTLFIDMLPASSHHAGVTFDTVGTFGFDLIVTLEGSVRGYDSTGALKFTYAAPSLYVFEGATVAPLSYGACPGCLFITAELASDVGSTNPVGPGAIYVVTPATPSGSAVTFWSNTPGPEPEGIVFVGFNQSSCSLSGYNYFVSGYAAAGQIDNPQSTNGAILAYTAAQLSGYAGQFLVPNEGSLGGGPGVIYAFSAPGVSTVFSRTTFQLEGATILACPGSPGRMTGGGSVFETDGTRVTHGFELHCDVADVPNNLEINWGPGNRFHLETLVSASCYTDPNINAGHPAAPFNTYVGFGTGDYNGAPGASAIWTFTDAGEPGSNDMATIKIKDVNGNTVLTVSGNLDSGNQQAHNDNK